jgi:hypothetical protein
MGLGGRVKGERRPRMASSVSSLRECERWRGDMLKEISRKVSKIQDCELFRGGWGWMGWAFDLALCCLRMDLNSCLCARQAWSVWSVCKVVILLASA